MSFGSRLRARREELGLKQSELGELLGVSGSAIGNYENGVSSPKADVLYQVFDVLRCDANYLFQDEMAELYKHEATPSEMEMIKKYRKLDAHGKDMVDMVLDKENARMESNVTIFPDPKMPSLEKNIASRDHHGLHAQTEEEKRREADLLKNLVGPDLEKMQKGKK